MLDTANKKKYFSYDYDAIIALAINQYFISDSPKCKYASKKITFREIDYAKGMAICVGKNIYGNFEVCDIELILVDNDMQIYFIGKKEMVYCSELGVCD